MPATKPCVFCTMDPGVFLDQNELAFVIRDANPVSDGHTLVIPKRHVSSFFDLTEPEMLAIMRLLKRAKAGIEANWQPDDYNIGINDGPNAGQTVPHVHVHVMPRYINDVPDARGGVRLVIPHKAIY